MRNKIFCIILLLWGISFCLYAAKKYSIKTPNRGYSVESVVGNIIATYDYNQSTPFGIFRDDSYLNTEKAIQKYISRVEFDCAPSIIEEYLYDMIVEYSQNTNSLPLLFRTSIIYLMTGFDTHFIDVYEIVIKMYAYQLNKDNVNYMLYYLKQTKGNKYEAKLAEWRADFKDILHNDNMASNARGIWITNACTDNVKYRNFPYCVIKVNSLNHQGLQLLSTPAFDNSYKMNTMLHTSQVVVGNLPNDTSPGLISADFCTQTFQQGMNVSSGFEQTRQFQANMMGKLSSGNYSTGQYIAGAAVTSAFSIGMNLLLLQMAQSSLEATALQVDMIPRTENIMDGHMIHFQYKVNTSTTSDIMPVMDKDIQFLRLLPEDSICFINEPDEPFNPYNLYIDQGAEFVKKYSWRNPKWGGPLVASIVAGVALYMGGLGMSILQPHRTDSEFKGGIALSIIGGVGFGVIAPVTLAIVKFKKKNAAIQQYNQAQMDLLRQRREAELSLSPSVNPINGEIGVSASIKY